MNSKKIVLNIYDRKEKIKQYKEKYQKVKVIFQKYSIFKQRLANQALFINNRIDYWHWYISEIEFTLSILNYNESIFLTEHFVHKITKSEMFVSNSKYYSMMNVVCEQFLTNLDFVFVQSQIQQQHAWS